MRFTLQAMELAPGVLTRRVSSNSVSSWVLRDRDGGGVLDGNNTSDFQARKKRAFFQCEEFWNSLDIFQERWQS